MWEPRPLATLGASTASNRDIFTFLRSMVRDRWLEGQYPVVSQEWRRDARRSFVRIVVASIEVRAGHHPTMKIIQWVPKAFSPWIRGAKSETITLFHVMPKLRSMELYFHVRARIYGVTGILPSTYLSLHSNELSILRYVELLWEIKYSTALISTSASYSVDSRL
jgi:hypothetical protein